MNVFPWHVLGQGLTPRSPETPPRDREDGTDSSPPNPLRFLLCAAHTLHSHPVPYPGAGAELPGESSEHVHFRNAPRRVHDTVRGQSLALGSPVLMCYHLPGRRPVPGFLLNNVQNADPALPLNSASSLPCVSAPPVVAFAGDFWVSAHVERQRGERLESDTRRSGAGPGPGSLSTLR